MDLTKVLKELYIERGKLDHAIISLEELQRAIEVGSPAPGKRRGRKFMSPAERQEVSARMRAFWKRRRHQTGS